MAFMVYLDGYETDDTGGIRKAIQDGLEEVFEFSPFQVRRATEAPFPKLLAVGLTREQAEVAVARLAMFGAYVRTVDEKLEPVDTVWDRLMRE